MDELSSDDRKRLTLDADDTPFRVVSMSMLRMDTMAKLLSQSRQFTHCVGVSPTGWNHGKKSALGSVAEKGEVTLLRLPYSEHSSFAELRDCVDWLRPGKIVPTVDARTKAAVQRQIGLLRQSSMASFVSSPEKAKA
eukprot:PLAT1595.2.p1 GENE.PLAT1595.2~~PLAT1595.2.p1  ORF type:complete len:137 (-),score=62.51 PLAT1595.2:66-476(-)